MLFRDYLELNGVGNEYLSNDGLLARLEFNQFMGSCFEPYEVGLRVSTAIIPLNKVIKSGLSLKFLKDFRTQTYKSSAPKWLFLITKVFDFFLRTNNANSPVFYGYIEGNNGKKSDSEFPFETFLKVTSVGTHWAQYQEPDGTIWQISHIPLCDISWIEVLPEISPTT
jgi:hypothetical protein